MLGINAQVFKTYVFFSAFNVSVSSNLKIFSISFSKSNDKSVLIKFNLFL